MSVLLKRGFRTGLIGLLVFCGLVGFFDHAQNVGGFGSYCFGELVELNWLAAMPQFYSCFGPMDGPELDTCSPLLGHLWPKL